MQFKRLAAAGLVASVAGLLAACNDDGSNNTVPVTPEPPKSATIRLIGFNDFHGNIDPTGTVSVLDPADATKTLKEPVGGAAYFATLIAQLKADNPLNVVVGAGDMIGASPLASALFHDEPTIQALSQMGLEFTSVGNHEFDKGKVELQRMQNGGCFPGGTVGADTCLQGGKFDGASFNYLAANVTDDATGKSLFPGYAIKSFNVSGGRKLNIAFIGLVLKETPTIVTPSGVAGLTFGDEAAAANALVPEIKSKGANAIVVLVHQGIFTGTSSSGANFDDKACGSPSGDLLPILDRLDPAIGVVVAGHTHTTFQCKGRPSNPNLIYTSAGKYGQYLTALDLTVDVDSGKIGDVTFDNKLTVNDTQANPAPGAYPTLAADANVKALVKVYDDASAPLKNKLIGSIAADLTRSADLTTGSSGEETLGDVIADAQLAATQGDAQKALVAFMNPGGIRADLQFSQISGGEQPGQVTFGEAFTVQPFGNSLVTLTLTGDQIYALLSQQWVGQTAPKILQISKGFTYTWDNSQPNDKKVIDGSVAIGGVAVDRAASYRVTVNNFMASGGDGFTILTQGKDNAGGAQDIDALVSYFKANSPVAVPTVNRIVRVN